MEEGDDEEELLLEPPSSPPRPRPRPWPLPSPPDEDEEPAPSPPRPRPRPWPLLPLEDEDLSKQIERQFRKRGIAQELGARFSKVDESSTGVVVHLESGKTIEADVLLTGTDLKSLRDASVSSRDFTEDAWAGVKQAIEGVGWAGHDARYIVLVTDAGGPTCGAGGQTGTGM